MNISNCSRKIFVALCALVLTTSLVQADPLLDKKRDLLEQCIKAKLIKKNPKDSTALDQNKYFFDTIFNARDVASLAVLSDYIQAIKPKKQSYWQRLKSYGNNNVKKCMFLAGVLAFAATAGVPVVAAPVIAAGAPIVSNVGWIGQLLSSGTQFGFTPQGILMRNYVVGLLCLPTGFNLLSKVYDRYLGTDTKS